MLKFIEKIFFILLFLSTSLVFSQKVDSLQKLLEQNLGKNDTFSIQILTKLADCYRDSNMSRFSEYAAQAYSIAMQLKDSIKLAELSVYMADSEYERKVYAIAMGKYFGAYKVFASVGRKNDAGMCLVKIATCYIEKDMDNAAKELLRQALSIFQETNDISGIAAVNENLGVIEMKNGFDEEALKKFQKVIDMYKNVENKHKIADVYTLASIVSRNSEEYETAKAYLDSALAIYSELRDNKNIANVHSLNGDLLMEQETYSLAEVSYNKANQIYIRFQNDEKMTEILLKLGILNFKQDLKNAATPFLQKTYELSVENGYGVLRREACLYLSKISSVNLDFKKAYEYQREYIKIRDSISLAKKQEDMGGLQEVFEAKKKEDELQILKLQNEAQETIIRNEKIMRYMLIGIAILGIGIMVFLYKQNRQKSKITRMLVDKNEQIEQGQKQLIETLNNLSKNEQELREANLTKVKLFSIIAHDLRNPIGTAKEMLHLLAADFSKFDYETVSEIIKSLSESSDATYNLLENLLMWARTQNDTLTYRPEIASVNKLIQNNIDSMMGSATKKSIRMFAEMPTEISAYFDSYMVTTVVRNLISNAVKFTHDKGEVKIIATIKETENIVQISFIDTGVGISPENMKKLFDKGQQFSTYGTHNEKGSGLGLTLCKEFIEKNKGQIFVESEVGKGSIFTITLPFKEIS